jgi:glutaconate CoA-transferase subunit B
MSATDVTPVEMMTVAMAREVVDGDFAGVGAAGHAPAAAMLLAQLTHAPNASWFSGGSGGVNPHPDTLYETSSDFRNLLMAEAVITMEDVVDFEMSMRFDLCFFGGMQIDRYGNVNMAVIGDWERPTVRGPGTVGTIFMGAFKRVILFTYNHSARTYVDKVDFVTGPGHLTGGNSRAERLRPESVGPVLVVTPLAVMDFEEESKHMRLRSYHAHSSVDEVLENTGFDLIVPDDVGETPAPTDEELTVLRGVVDREGVLRRRP